MVTGMLSMCQMETSYLMLKSDHGNKRFTFVCYKPRRTSSIDMWLDLRQRKILVELLHLWVLTIMKGYRMKNAKGFSFWKDN